MKLLALHLNFFLNFLTSTRVVVSVDVQRCTEPPVHQGAPPTRPASISTHLWRHKTTCLHVEENKVTSSQFSLVTFKRCMKSSSNPAAQYLLFPCLYPLMAHWPGAHQEHLGPTRSTWGPPGDPETHQEILGPTRRSWGPPGDPGAHQEILRPTRSTWVSSAAVELLLVHQDHCASSSCLLSWIHEIISPPEKIT